MFKSKIIAHFTDDVLSFLLSGLGTISLGSIIFFVGTGEKGFKTQELRMIGPALAGNNKVIHS
jgi:hypothetical protein